MVLRIQILVVLPVCADLIFEWLVSPTLQYSLQTKMSQNLTKRETHTVYKYMPPRTYLWC
jgi:hypothetical protein